MHPFKTIRNFIKKTLGGTISSFSYRSSPAITDLLSSNNTYFDLNEVSLYVNRGIQKRSQKVGQTKFKLIDKQGNEVTENPVLNLLDRPNQKQTGVQFWALASEYRDISGFAVIRMMNKSEGEVFKDVENIDHLEVLNSNKVQINYNGDEIISFTHTLRDGQQEVIPFDECIYWFRPDPRDPTQGMSLLKAGIYSIDTDNQLSMYQNAIVKNGGTTDTVFSFENGLTSAQIEDLKKKHIEERRDAKNADMPYFLGGKAKIERLGMTPSELAYLETKKIYARDMAVITGVPSVILGITSDETFANAEMAYRVFIRETIKPIIDDLVNTLNWKLVPEDLELSYEDPSPDDVDVKVKLATALYNVDASTINERREILGLDKFEDESADELYVSFAKQPLGYKEPDVTEDLSFKKKSANNAEHILKDKVFRDMYRKVAKTRADKREKIFYSMITNYFEGQKTRVLEAIPAEKAVTKALVDEVLNEQLEIRIASGSALPLLRRFLIEAGKETVDMLDFEEGFSLTETIEKWLNNRSRIFAKEITDTTYDKLKSEFKQSADAGETRAQLIQRIESVYSGFDQNRARTIARTETHGAVQKGNLEGSVQAGSEVKIWVAVMDDDTRDSHEYLDGEERPINKRFSNGLMYAGDAEGEPAETINCRCSTV